MLTKPLLLFCTGPLYKESHLEIDINGKSDRVEWGHAKYHTCYRPDLAYEMVIKWAAASGAIVADLVSYLIFNDSWTIAKIVRYTFFFFFFYY